MEHSIMIQRSAKREETAPTGGENIDDSVMIEGLWSRDEAALQAVSKQYGKYCLTVARNIVGNEQTAEECVQDALMRLWEAIPPNRPTNLQAFIGKITRNIALNTAKALNAAKRGGNEAVLPFDDGPEIADKNSIESLAERHELITEINAFLEGIAAEKRKIFVLRYWHCFSIADISRIVGMSEVNVASHLKRVRKKLLEHLNKRGY